MCLAIPMKVVSVDDETAVVDSSGVEMQVGLALVEDVAPGDYVIVHAGYAINVIDPEEAKQTLEIFARMEQSLES